MKLPWQRDTRDPEEWSRAEMRVELVRGHLRVLVNELERLLDRAEGHHQGGQASE